MRVYLQNSMQVAWSSNWHKASWLAAIGAGANTILMAFLDTRRMYEAVVSSMVLATLLLIAVCFLTSMYAEPRNAERWMRSLYFNAVCALLVMIPIVMLIELVNFVIWK